MDKNEKDILGNCEDLICELEFKLLDLKSHIKFLSNSTNSDTDFNIEIKDVNNFSLTMYDKITDMLNVLGRLSTDFEKFESS